MFDSKLNHFISQFLKWFPVIVLSASALGSIETILVYKIGMIIVGFECSICPVILSVWSITRRKILGVMNMDFPSINEGENMYLPQYCPPFFLSLFSSFIDLLWWDPELDLDLPSWHG